MPSPPPPPPQMDSQREANQAVRSDPGDVLEKGIRRARGGGGRRSLLSKSGKGGMGFYNQFLDT